MANERCCICGGPRDEHEGRVHAFTLKEGDLRTPEAPKNSSTGQMVVMRGGGGPELGRLVEVLIKNGVISQEDALYVFMGQSPSAIQVQFTDPTSTMKQ